MSHKCQEVGELVLEPGPVTACPLVEMLQALENSFKTDVGLCCGIYVYVEGQREKK